MVAKALLEILALALLAGPATGTLEEYLSACGGSWQKTYTKLHRAVSTSRAKRPKYLIAIPQYRQTTAASMNMYVNAFLWALLSKRALFIYNSSELFHCDRSSVSYAFNSRFIDFNLNNISNLNVSYLAHLKTSEPTFSDVHIHKYTNLSAANIMAYMYRDQLQALGTQDLSAFPAEATKLNRSASFDVLFTSLEKSILQQVFTSEANKKALHSLGFHSAKNAYSCIYHFLFTPVAPISIPSHLSLLLGDSNHTNMPSNVVKVGVQLRFECSAAPQYMYCMDGLQQSYSEQGKSVLFVVFTESYHIQKIMLAKYKDVLFLPTANPTAPFDFIPKELLHNRSITRDECNRILALDENNLRAAVRDLHILSVMDAYILSNRGSLGLVGALSSLRHGRDFPMFGISIDHKERRLCNGSGDSLEAFADA